MHWSLRICCALSAVIAATILAGRPTPLLLERPSEKRPLYRPTGALIDFRGDLARERPQLVLLGNSLLGRAVGEDELERLAGVRTLKMNHGGAASAMWYLLLKNVIVPADPRPKLVAIMFRDTYLTEPDYRVQGEFKERIDYYAGDEEPDLDRVAYLGGMGRVDFFLERRWALFQKRERVKSSLEGWAKADAPGLLLGRTAAEVEGSVERAFAERNMDSELLDRAQLAADVDLGEGDHFDFAGRLERSFLPLMVELAAENDIQLVMLRAKVRRDAQPFPPGFRPPPFVEKELPAYVAQLEVYLTEHGIPLIDFSHDERIRREHYLNGDHLNQTSGMPLFTRILAEEMEPYLAPLR